jgi:hypothetical protein
MKSRLTSKDVYDTRVLFRLCCVYHYTHNVNVLLRLSAIHIGNRFKLNVGVTNPYKILSAEFANDPHLPLQTTLTSNFIINILIFIYLSDLHLSRFCATRFCLFAKKLLSQYMCITVQVLRSFALRSTDRNPLNQEIHERQRSKF